MKYSITRALAELKTLKARYSKELSNLNVVAVARGGKLLRPNSSVLMDDFKGNAVSQLQSVEAILRRMTIIKSKIDQINATTLVKIGSREMTIQEALVEKNFIDAKKSLLNTLKVQYSNAKNALDTAINENNAKIERLVDQQISALGQANKVDIESITNTTKEAFEKANGVELVDAIGLEDRIKSLEAEIEDFTTNVDFALSEINSTTFIEVED